MGLLHQKDPRLEEESPHLVASLCSKLLRNHCKNRFLTRCGFQHALNEHQWLLKISIQALTYFWII